MNFDEIFKAIAEFQAKQKADADAFASGLQESIKTAIEAQSKTEKAQKPPRRERKRRYTYVYVMGLPDGKWAIRFHHIYKGGYLRRGIATENEAHDTAKYLNDKLHEFATVVTTERQAALLR